jgi:hypothetical protein
MTREYRKSRRQTVRYPVWIDSGSGGAVRAVLTDVSDTGARVELPTAGSLPSHVILRLSETGGVLRRCGVVWAAGGRLGLRFDAPAVNPRRPGWVG